MKFLGACLILALASATAPAASVSVTWGFAINGPPPSCRVYYGITSGGYTNFVDAGTNSQATVTGLIPGVTYYLAALAYDSEGDVSLFSNEITNRIPAPPLITAQPVSETIAAGTPVVLSVIASGDPPLKYQWLDAFVPIPGATNSTLSWLKIASTNAGNYAVMVYNASGSVVSSVATVTVTVMAPPSFLTQPKSQTVIAWTAASFSSAASGTAPLSNQWFFGSAAIPGATNSALSWASVAPSNAGSYYLRVANAAGAVTSSIVTLTVLVPPAIVTQPQSQTVIASTAASFSSVATGTAPLSNQWFFGSAAIPGATNSALAWASVAPSNAGSYYLRVANAAGAVTSAVVTLTVVASLAPSIVTQPQSQTVIALTAASFSSTATGTGPLSNQWFFGSTAISGATNSTLSWASVAPSNAGSYYLRVANAAGAVTSSIVTLTVLIPPALVTQPQSQTVVASTAASFLSAATGTAPLSNQWFFGSTAIPGATNSALSWASVAPSNAGSYYLRVANAAGAVTSSVVTLTVLIPPTLVTQPQSQTVIASTPAAFLSAATGTAPLSNQWFFGSTAIPGATNSALSWASVAPSNAGSYYLRVANAAGAVTSSVVTLTVLVPPTLVTQPQSQTVIASTAASFSSAATGTAPLTNQWFFGGAAIPGATNSTLGWASVASSNAGNYFLTVANAAGAVTSSVVTLTVVAPSAPSIVTQPQSQTVIASNAASFSCAATGPAPLSNQWFFGSTAIPGATNSTLSWASVAPSNAGSYYLRVANAAGAVTSSVVTLTVLVPPTLVTQPQSQTVIASTAASFSSAATGTAPLTNQWFFGGAAIPGATNSTLGWASVAPSNAGNYYLTVANAAGAVTSSVVTLTVVAPSVPSIVTQPQSQTVIASNAASFSCAATGPAPLSNQWFFGSTAIPGATNSTLSWASVAPSNAGSYYLTVANAAGAVTSSIVTLTVLVPPTLVTQPQSQTVIASTAASFSSAATGTAPLTNQWFFGGAAIPGATNSTLGWASVAPSNAGNYFLTVANAAGAVTSSIATLTVLPTNTIATVAGAYNGLFFQTNANGTPAISEGTAGFLGNCIVSSNGAFSARVYVGGQPILFSGVFDIAGDVSVTRSLGNGGNSPTLTAALHLDLINGTQQITGTISSASTAGSWSSSLLGYRATNAFPQTDVALVLTPQSSPNAPTNSGAASGLIVGGVLTLTGTMADTAAISQSVPISAEGNVPFYVSLYNNTGLALGWINLAGGAVSGNLTWIRPSGVALPAGFPLGFDTVVQVTGTTSGP